MQCEAAKTAAIRSKQPRSGSLTMRSSCSTQRVWNAVGVLSVRFETLTVFRARAQQFRCKRQDSAPHHERQPAPVAGIRRENQRQGATRAAGQFTKRLIRRKMRQSVGHWAAQISWAACSSQPINALPASCLYGQLNGNGSRAPYKNALASLEGL
jgi:hypothetical protein